jgi:ABC-type polysaccharide/polyol phosphate transport system ATPase subunit
MNDNNSDVVIRVEGLWKRYGLPPAEGMRHRIKRYLRVLRHGPKALADKPNWNKNDAGLWSLRDVNFEVRRGETFGIIGRNGSGKSTILKLLTQTSHPSYGKIMIKGSVFSMIELNAGMNMDLTGRENVQLLSTIMGFSPRWVARKMQEIEDFCGLGEFFDRPVWQYSSGMLARLGFAVAVNTDAEILIVDEVLAVGDFIFQKKCINKIEELVKTSVTVVLVSHNVYQIERMCDRAIFLDHGSVSASGKPEEVVPLYLKLIDKVEDKATVLEERAGTGSLRFTKIEILDRNNEPLSKVYSGDDITIRLHYLAHESIIGPIIRLWILDQLNTEIACVEMRPSKVGFEFIGEGCVDCVFYNLNLMPNTYTIQVKMSYAGLLIDMWRRAYKLIVEPSTDVLIKTGNRGIVYLKNEWVINPNRESVEISEGDS